VNKIKTRYPSFINDLKSNFEKNVALVEELMHFDRFVVDFCIQQIQTLNEKIKSNPHVKGNKYLHADNIITNLTNIRQNDSMKLMYSKVNNQCLVLLVSYFSSSIREIFIRSLEFAFGSPLDLKLKTEELKLSFKEIEELVIFGEISLGKLFVEKKEISFQDMQSIVRAFKSYLEIDIDRDNNINNIIFSQACRHVIVHSLSKADIKFIKQVQSATSRDLKTAIIENEEIIYSPEELGIVKNSMIHFIEEVCQKVEEKLKHEVEVFE